MATFKVSLKELMEKHGIERMELVREAGIAYKTVLNWQDGKLDKLDASTVNRVLNFLNTKYGLSLSFHDVIEFDSED